MSGSEAGSKVGILLAFLRIFRFVRIGRTLRKLAFVIWGFFIISIIAQVTFALLFQDHMYSSVSGSVQYLKSNGMGQFLAFTKSQIDPLLKVFDFVMDVWLVINAALLFVAVVLSFMD
jgi:hypothetical protein